MGTQSTSPRSRATPRTVRKAIRLVTPRKATPPKKADKATARKATPPKKVEKATARKRKLPSKHEVASGPDCPEDPLGLRVGLGPDKNGHDCFQRPSDAQLAEVWARWTPKEQQVFRRLDSPEKIQRFIDALKYDAAEDLEYGVCSLRVLLRTRRAHCLPSSMLACYALSRLGYECALVGLDVEDEDEDAHSICVFRQPFHGSYLYGALGKSNWTTLRNRDCVYASVRELVMSYYDWYFSVPKGEKVMTGWVGPFNPFTDSSSRCLGAKGDEWLFSEDDLEKFELQFDTCMTYTVLPWASEKSAARRGLASVRAAPLLRQAAELGARGAGR